MSETFYIKKTAFNDNLVGSPPAPDFTQRDLDSFIIGPGELNGPGGIARDSDLELYGFGSLKWGEGVDQNQYRQLENFACPQKVTGDYWAAGSPPEGAYDSNIHLIAPKDENDLGIGNGITTPLEAQWWYNTTNEIIYIFTAAGTWRNSHTLLDTLDMVGNAIINLGDPDFPATTLPGSVTTINKQDALTVGWSDLRYVNLTGDTMTGILNMGANKIQFMADPTDPPGTLPGSLAFPQDAVTVEWADNRYVNLTGDTMTGHLNMSNQPILNVANATSGFDALNWNVGDSRYVTQEIDSQINQTSGVSLIIHNDNIFSEGALTATSGLLMWNNNGAGRDAFVAFKSGSNYYFNLGLDDNTSDLFVGGGVMGPAKNKVWHEGNDGTGSGLDADMLDGQHASDFLTTGAGYAKLTFQTLPPIFSYSVNNSTNHISRNVVGGLTYGVPITATHVLLRISLRAIAVSYRIDLHHSYVTIGGKNVCGLSSDSSVYSSTFDSRATSEVWVPVGDTAYAHRWLHYGSGIVDIWVIAYKE